MLQDCTSNNRQHDLQQLARRFPVRPSSPHPWYQALSPFAVRAYPRPPHLIISPTTGQTRTTGTTFHITETKDIQISHHYIGALISSRTIAGNRHQQLSQTSKDIHVKKVKSLLLAQTYLLRKLCSTKQTHIIVYDLSASSH